MLRSSVGSRPTLRVIQFPLRLDGYVVLLTSALVLVSVLAVQRGIARSAAVARGAGALGYARRCLRDERVARGLAGMGAEVVPAASVRIRNVSRTDRRMTPTHVLPTTWGAGNYYTDTETTLVPVAPGRSFDFSPELVDPHGDRLMATMILPGGTEPFVTNIMGGPGLVSIRGASSGSGEPTPSYVVVRRVRPGDGPVRVVIRTADTPAIRIGRLLSLAGVLGLALLLSMLALSSRDRRLRARAAVLQATSTA